MVAIAANPRLAVLRCARLERTRGASLAREHTAEAALMRVAGHIIMLVASVAALLVWLLVRIFGIDAAPAIRIKRITVVEAKKPRESGGHCVRETRECLCQKPNAVVHYVRLPMLLRPVTRTRERPKELDALGRLPPLL